MFSNVSQLLTIKINSYATIFLRKVNISPILIIFRNNSLILGSVPYNRTGLEYLGNLL